MNEKNQSGKSGHRRYSKLVTETNARAASRGMLYGVGFKKGDFQKKAILHVRWSFSRNDPKKPYNQLKYCPNMFLTLNMMFPTYLGNL